MGNLLEYLAEKLGCAFLSDLRESPSPGSMRKTIREIPADAFPVKQWKDAVAYLTGRDADFASAQEAKEYLSNYDW